MKTKLFFATFLLSIILCKNSVAQSDGFENVKGVNLLNLGIGVGTYGLSGTGGLPLTASFEHGFTDKITGGVSLGYVRRTYLDDWRYTYLIFGARASYHFNELINHSVPNLDIYGGAGLFYRRYKHSYKGDFGDQYGDSSGGDVDIDIHAGGRYLFNERFGGFAEVGYGISPLQVGFTMKF